MWVNVWLVPSSQLLLLPKVGCWRAAPMSQTSLMSALSTLCILEQDVFQPRTVRYRNMLLSCSNSVFACSLPASALAQMGKAWDGLTLVWSSTGHASAIGTEQDSSPDMLGTLASLEKICSYLYKNHIIFKYIPGYFRGSFLPWGLSKSLYH